MQEIFHSGQVPWEAIPWERLHRVGAFVAEHRLLGSGERILVACSGGGDSLALLALMAHPGFARVAGLSLGPRIVVGHVDHGLRPGSREDAAAVARLAERLGLECVAESLHFGEDGVDREVDLRVSEARLRDARLTALRRLAAEVGAMGVALGHTASDQMETLLMRLVRGSGLEGMAGMAPRRGPFLRPILPLSREDTGALVSALGWCPRLDPSNQTDGYLRNRIRRHVVPLLVAENPRASQAAFRTAAVLREELEALQRAEAATWERVGDMTPVGPSVKVEALRALPPGLASRLLRRMWGMALARGEETSRTEETSLPLEEAGNGKVQLGRTHLERVRTLLASEVGTRSVDLPGGLVALRSYDRLVLCHGRNLADPGDLEWDIPGPGVYPLDGLGWSLEVLEMAPGLDAPREELVSSAGTLEALTLGLSDLGEPGAWSLRVRNNRPGDRVSGAQGRRKVSDLLVDAKIPRPLRRRLPVLVRGQEILWIPGIWMQNPLAVTAQVLSCGAPEQPPSAVCRLRFRPVGGSLGLGPGPLSEGLRE